MTKLASSGRSDSLYARPRISPAFAFDGGTGGTKRAGGYDKYNTAMTMNSLIISKWWDSTCRILPSHCSGFLVRFHALCSFVRLFSLCAQLMAVDGDDGGRAATMRTWANGRQPVPLPPLPRSISRERLSIQ